MGRIGIGLAVLLVFLQYRLWVGDGSLAEVWSLKQDVVAQSAENETLTERNLRLEAEVVDLKQGADVIEDRARRDLGFIRRNETFFQIVDR
ncbi:MAG: cell division protein FtsB [Gammaproteobacteria bacterium]